MGETALMKAVQADSGHLEVVRLLLEHGAEVNGGNVNGTTALMMNLYEAPTPGNDQLFQLLIDRRPNVNAKSGDGTTALMVAAAFGRLGAVKTLLARGARVNERDDQGKTALAAARNNGPPNQASIILLLKQAGAREP
jgi:ankyrin repeat protein